MLARVARTRRAAIIGAGALTAAFAAVVAIIAPGRSSAQATPASKTAAATAQTGARMPPLASPSQLGLGPPGSAPQAPAPAPTQTQAAPAPAAPVSGGS